MAYKEAEKIINTAWENAKKNLSYYYKVRFFKT